MLPRRRAPAPRALRRRPARRPGWCAIPGSPTATPPKPPPPRPGCSGRTSASCGRRATRGPRPDARDGPAMPDSLRVPAVGGGPAGPARCREDEGFSNRSCLPPSVARFACPTAACARSQRTQVRMPRRPAVTTKHLLAGRSPCAQLETGHALGERYLPRLNSLYTPASRRRRPVPRDARVCDHRSLLEGLSGTFFLCAPLDTGGESMLRRNTPWSRPDCRNRVISRQE
ncbi:hypothetical protein CBM2629_A190066 [Cupriavidus taiwanensis]|nr:hypothetical protein CBM2629_A190066 [Cupriavidus taiwanensis]